MITYAEGTCGPWIYRILTGEFRITPQAIKEEVCDMLKCNGGRCESSTSCHSTYSHMLSEILQKFKKKMNLMRYDKEQQTRSMKKKETSFITHQRPENKLTSGLP